jgi:predicted amidohydrolase YtcJ
MHSLRFRAAILLTACAATATLSLRAQSSANLILTNGKIVTVDERFTIAQALAVRGDRIVAVGSNAEISRLADTSTRRIDLHGRTVVPGFIDNHMHLLRAATTWGRELRWDGVYSRKQAIDLLKARVQSAGRGQWVFSIGGWATAQFSDDPRPFTREELDRVAPDNPVALQESYYQIVLNSRALDDFGIRPGQPDPDDFIKGTIQRDATGRPTGIIKGDIPATRPVQARLPKIAAGELEASTRSLIADMNRAGLTTFGVPGCLPEPLQILRRLHQQNQLNLRVFCIEGPTTNTPEQVDAAIQQIRQMKPFQGDDYIDEIAFGESVYQPLHDPMFAVRSSPSADQLANWRRIATAIAEQGLSLQVHANLTGTIDAFLDQIEAINKIYPVRNLRWALAHLNQVNAAQLERMKKLGLYAAVHPWSVINGAIMQDGFGEASAADLSPLDLIQRSGITWGFGSDGSAANQYLPMTQLYYALTGKLPSGKVVMRHPIGREDALIAYTRKNAYFVFRENDIGSIQVGKLADVVALDRDYLTVPLEQIRDIKPVLTIVGGRVAYSADPEPPSRTASLR